MLLLLLLQRQQHEQHKELSAGRLKGIESQVQEKAFAAAEKDDSSSSISSQRAAAVSMSRPCRLLAAANAQAYLLLPLHIRRAAADRRTSEAWHRYSAAAAVAAVNVLQLICLSIYQRGPEIGRMGVLSAAAAVAR